MKRNKYLFAVLLLAAALLTGCGDKNVSDDSSAENPSAASADEGGSTPADENADDTNSTGETITVREDGSEVITLDDGTMIIHTETGFEWFYLGGVCRVNLPPEWADRFVVRGTSVYCKKIYDTEEGCGELFSLQFINESAFVQETKPAALLGIVRKMYAVAVIPDAPNYDTANEELNTEYQDMLSSLSSVFQTAVCEGNTEFTPIDLSGYVPAAEAAESVLYGTWTAKTTDDASQMTPFMTFRSRDSAVGYHYSENGVSLGSFLVSQNAETDAGLALMNGRIFRVTYTPDEPQTLTFELLLMSRDSSDTLNGQTFGRESDTETIYQRAADETELEL